MAMACGCEVPDGLLYWVKEHVWVREEEDGTVTVGMTDAAQHLAGKIVTATPKKVGRKVVKGRSTGTVESSKWVGPIKAPLTGEIVAANEDLAKNPGVLNDDPFGQGWFVRVRPASWEIDRADLVTGVQAVADYETFLQAEGIDCSH